ncbi:MAG: hypothetical protein K2N58_01450, partial [Treponemataceae bacterium]|nr:hypothetical protein [Treponemataceae bacterium]
PHFFFNHYYAYGHSCRDVGLVQVKNLQARNLLQKIASKNTHLKISKTIFKEDGYEKERKYSCDVSQRD